MAMIKIQFLGAGKAILALEDMKRRTEGGHSVVVGYGTHYALAQHENLNYRHNPPTTARFLTRPARQLKKRYRRLIWRLIYRGGTFEQGLEACGHLLASASRNLCPIDTGLLRSTLTVRKEM